MVCLVLVCALLGLLQARMFYVRSKVQRGVEKHIAETVKEHQLFGVYNVSPQGSSSENVMLKVADKTKNSTGGTFSS